jgi:hypothetical protein
MAKRAPPVLFACVSAVPWNATREGNFSIFLLRRNAGVRSAPDDGGAGSELSHFPPKVSPAARQLRLRSFRSVPCDPSRLLCPPEERGAAGRAHSAQTEVQRVANMCGW